VEDGRLVEKVRERHRSSKGRRSLNLC
jgi:hypothetical protein